MTTATDHTHGLDTYDLLGATSLDYSAETKLLQWLADYESLARRAAASGGIVGGKTAAGWVAERDRVESRLATRLSMRREIRRRLREEEATLRALPLGSRISYAHAIARWLGVEPTTEPLEPCFDSLLSAAIAAAGNDT